MQSACIRAVQASACDSTHAYRLLPRSPCAHPCAIAACRRPLTYTTKMAPSTTARPSPATPRPALGNESQMLITLRRCCASRRAEDRARTRRRDDRSIWMERRHLAAVVRIRFERQVVALGCDGLARSIPAVSPPEPCNEAVASSETGGSRYSTRFYATCTDDPACITSVSRLPTSESRRGTRSCWRRPGIPAATHPVGGRFRRRARRRRAAWP